MKKLTPLLVAGMFLVRWTVGISNVRCDCPDDPKADSYRRISRHWQQFANDYNPPLPEICTVTLTQQMERRLLRAELDEFMKNWPTDMLPPNIEELLNADESPKVFQEPRPNQTIPTKELPR